MKKNRFFQDISESDEGSINLTPLIDVVFIVLIAFILIAPMLEIDLVNLADGKSEGNTFTTNTNIQIVVNENNSVLINNKEVFLSQIESVLSMYRNKYPEDILQIFHDRKASFGTYQAIKNAAENSGFEEIQVILKPS